MSNNYEDIGDILTNIDTAHNMVRDILKSYMYPVPPEEISFELYAILISGLELYIDKVFKYATSRVEILFFNSVIVASLKSRLFRVNIMPPLHTATEQVENVRNIWSSVMELWKKYQVTTENKSMDSFLQFTNNESDYPDEIKRTILGGLHHAIYDYYGTFNLSLKSAFPDLIVQGRKVTTSLFIWKLSNPKIKIMVDIDEFSHYSNKANFSIGRERDRLLQTKGFQVLRFSEYEIVSDPLGQAIQLLNFLEQQR